MTTWVLIMTLLVNDSNRPSASVETVEFNTKADCIAAAELWRDSTTEGDSYTKFDKLVPLTACVKKSAR